MERLERLTNRLDAYVTVVTTQPDQAPYVVVGDREDLAADYAVEIIRRHSGDALIDPDWLAAHPYPRSRTGHSTSWLDQLLDDSEGDHPNVIRIGPAPLVQATIRRPDVAPETEYQPYRGVIIRRSMFTDGELIEYRVWNRTARISNRFTTHAGFRRFMTHLAVDLGLPHPEEWRSTHQPWSMDPDDRP